MISGEVATVELDKVQVDYLYMLLTIHEQDQEASPIRAILDVPRAEWDAEVDADLQ